MILIDSTIYINWFRTRTEPRLILEPWIRAGAAATCGIVRVEVVRGMIDVRQKAKVEAMFDTLHDVGTDEELWRNASELAWKLDRTGAVLPLSDIAIAACALSIDATVVTTDGHFTLVPGLGVRASLPQFP